MDDKESSQQPGLEGPSNNGTGIVPLAAGAAARMVQMIMSRLYSPHAGIGARSFSGGSLWQQVSRRLGYGATTSFSDGAPSPLNIQRAVEGVPHIDLVWRTKKHPQVSEQYDDWGPRQPAWYTRRAPASRTDSPDGSVVPERESEAELLSAPIILQQNEAHLAPHEDSSTQETSSPPGGEVAAELPAFVPPTVVRVGYVPEPMVAMAQPLVSAPIFTTSARTGSSSNATPLVAPSLGSMTIARQPADGHTQKIAPTTDLLHRIAERREQKIPDAVPVPRQSVSPSPQSAPQPLIPLPMPLADAGDVRRSDSLTEQPVQQPRTDQGLLLRFMERVASVLPFRSETHSSLPQVSAPSGEANPVSVQSVATAVAGNLTSSSGGHEAQGIPPHQGSEATISENKTERASVIPGAPTGFLAAVRSRFLGEGSPALTTGAAPSELPMPLASPGRVPAQQPTPGEQSGRSRTEWGNATPSATPITSTPRASGSTTIAQEPQVVSAATPGLTPIFAESPQATQDLEVSGALDVALSGPVRSDYIGAPDASTQGGFTSGMPSNDERRILGVAPGGSRVDEGAAAEFSPPLPVETGRPPEGLFSSVISRLLRRTELSSGDAYSGPPPLDMTLVERADSAPESVSQVETLASYAVTSDGDRSPERPGVPTSSTGEPTIEVSPAQAIAANPLPSESPATMGIRMEPVPPIPSSVTGNQPEGVSAGSPHHTLANVPGIVGAQQPNLGVSRDSDVSLAERHVGTVTANIPPGELATMPAVPVHKSDESREITETAITATASAQNSPARKGIFAELFARLVGGETGASPDSVAERTSPRLTLPWTPRTPSPNRGQDHVTAESWDMPASTAATVAFPVPAQITPETGLETEPVAYVDTHETSAGVTPASVQAVGQHDNVEPHIEALAVPAPAGLTDFTGQEGASFSDGVVPTSAATDTPTGVVAPDLTYASSTLEAPATPAGDGNDAVAWVMLESLAVEIASSHSHLGAIDIAEVVPAPLLERLLPSVDGVGSSREAGRMIDIFARAGITLGQSSSSPRQTGIGSHDLARNPLSGLGVLTGGVVPQIPLTVSASISSQAADPQLNSAVSGYGFVDSERNAGQFIARQLRTTSAVPAFGSSQFQGRSSLISPAVSQYAAPPDSNAPEEEGNTWMAVLRSLYGDNSSTNMPLAYAGQALSWSESSNGAESFDVSSLLARHAAQEYAAASSPATYPGSLDTYNSSMDESASSFTQATGSSGWIGGSADVNGSEAGAWADVVSSAVSSVPQGGSPSLALAGEERSPTGGQNGSQDQQEQMEEADNPNPDIDELAQSVYAIIRRKLTIERERSRT